MTNVEQKVVIPIFSLYVINKAGGLIYQKDFASIPKLQANDYLRLASTFHGLHAISGRGLNSNIRAKEKEKNG